MGKATGFMEYQRHENPFRDAQERLMDFEDLHVTLSEAERRQQAARCMNCGVPYCQSGYGCPLHNLIPEWNELIYQGQFQEALARLLVTAPFPEFTGRVCPGLCEKACMMEEEATTNRDNERFLIEEGFRRGWIQPRIPQVRSSKSIAVVGSGPAGLAAADLLNRMGHCVTVIERSDRPGGLLTYGIPNMKLPKDIVARRIGLMKAEGVLFQMNTCASPNLLDEYDAVVLCAGARRPRTLNVSGEDAAGVVFAVDFLSENTRALLEQRVPAISAQGKDVIVVGGGDTGNDCVGTCLRQGCRSICQLELLPRQPAVRAISNPWPEWPRILRTDYGQVEAAAVQGEDPRRFQTTVRRVIADEKGAVSSVELVELEFGTDGKMRMREDSQYSQDCQLLLIAAGFLGCEPETAKTFQFSLTQRGVPDLLPGRHMISPGLFAAGDMRNGQSLVVRAMADGREAAMEVHRWLMGC